ncbi:hypothetical protein TPHA_0F03090 [Tetrapisispora phaffii CBS 4417]|uniref:D-lactate dehydrogenase (cytochrome) n=1 Tax=Tetrapisispora phaffii (strain ATCC 24235 / CBS 4417 / NBRC 1672 / NRRL Y-8282 / UCD 70-5) TaxID=1071381 RepID=G8BUK4_TETPH|nr:hypothetical protein TPHA_0F03090 [Tetrapisispora phaffii CBS 4417]CCE63790.1 hypothetical protein TPHA_0F03090 [Tetrapisispora phaffii CBS 4417]
MLKRTVTTRLYKKVLNRAFNFTKLSKGNHLLNGSRLYTTASNINKVKRSKKYTWLLTWVIMGAAGYELNNFVNDRRIVKRNFEPESSTLPLDRLTPPRYETDPEKLKLHIEDLKKIMDNDSNNYTEMHNELVNHADSYFNTHHPQDIELDKPTIVLFPRNTQDVSKILKYCHTHNLPVIPYSGGTSLEGHYVTTRPPSTIMVDFSRYMANIIKFSPADLDVTVQPGLPWEDLNDFLEEKGYMLGVDPGPGAQMGGCIANSCSGTNAYRFGTMKENIINITLVLPDGTIVKTKRRPRKSSAGYNLNGLFVGSEGTLGVVTEATVKCHVKPKCETVAVVTFPTIQDAANCSSKLTQNGIQLNAMELLDENIMKLINLSKSTYKQHWDETPTMFFKIGGQNETIVRELIHMMKRIAKENKSIKFEFSNGEEEKLEMWEARKVAVWTVLDTGKAINEDAKLWTTDVAVPLSNFAKVVEETKADLKESKLLNIIVGHAGDGNFHAAIVYNNEEEFKKCKKVVDDMITRALDHDGTCTGEHGVALGKRKYLLEELDEDTVDLMRRIKLAIDPNRILNPDKIFKIDPNDTAE